MTITGLELLITTYADSGDGDEWGSAMGWLFATHEVLYHESAEQIPTAWGISHGQHYAGFAFRPHVAANSGGSGTGETDTQAEILELLDTGYVTDDDLIEFGTYLNGVIGDLIAAGKDY